MPLVRSPSEKARSENIRREIRAGRSPKQAAAIAYSIQRKEQRKRGLRVTPKPKADPPRRKKKRTLSPAQLAALAKGRARMAAKRAGKKASRGSSLTPRVKRDTVRGMAKRGRKRSRSKALAVAGHRGARRARHAARAVAHTAGQEKHRTGAFIVAAGLGIAKKQGFTIPHVETVGEAGSLALGAWAARKFAGIRSPWLDHLITAAGVIAIYDAASTGNIPLLSAAAGGGGGKKKEGAATTSGDEEDELDGVYPGR